MYAYTFLGRKSLSYRLNKFDILYIYTIQIYLYLLCNINDNYILYYTWYENQKKEKKQKTEQKFELWNTGDEEKHNYEYWTYKKLFNIWYRKYYTGH